MFGNTTPKKSEDIYPFLHGKKEENASFFEVARGELIFGSVLLLIFLVLNYFNIIPVSKNLPRLFGFLPHIDLSANKSNDMSVLPTPAKAPNPTAVPYLSCPVIQQLCATGVNRVETVSGKKEYSLIFDDVSKNFFIYAALSGVVSIENLKSFSIKDMERGLEVRYVLTDDLTFTPDVKNGSKVTEKQVIGNFTNDKNSITLIATSIILKESIQLGVEKNGKYLTNSKGM